MKKRKVSIKDIASHLQVSVTTVSFVLNGKAKEKRISEEVTKKILDYSEEIDYKPSVLAQSLRTGKSKIIVCMVEDISNSFFAKFARLIEERAYKEGYKVLFCSNENNDDRSIELLKLFKERQVEAYIIVPSPGIKNTIKSLIEEEIPVVLFDRHFPNLETHYVGIKNESAAFQATSKLIENNFKNIGFITIDSKQSQMMQRLDGYKKAMAKHKLQKNIIKIPFPDKPFKDIKKDINNYFNKNSHIDALFFATNYLTQSGLEVLKENFSEELSNLGIITFDDNELFNTYTPSISAISQPLEEMANWIMKIIFEKLQDPSFSKEFKEINLPASLKLRESSSQKKSKFTNS